MNRAEFRALISRGFAQNQAVREHICRIVRLVGFHIRNQLLRNRFSLKITRLVNRREPRHKHMREQNIVEAEK